MSSGHPVRSHYFLIAGVILFSTNAEGVEDTIGSAPANAIVRHDDLNFPVHKLAKAQQNLHKAFMMKMPDEARAMLNINDIVVTHVSHLGHMTEDEFQYQPPVAPAPAAVTEVV